jgi:hypothetical protein
MGVYASRGRSLAAMAAGELYCADGRTEFAVFGGEEAPCLRDWRTWRKNSPANTAVSCPGSMRSKISWGGMCSRE